MKNESQKQSKTMLTGWTYPTQIILPGVRYSTNTYPDSKDPEIKFKVKPSIYQTIRPTTWHNKIKAKWEMT